MNHFEDELRVALRVEEPPTGFADRVLERVAEESFQTSVRLPQRRFWHWRFPIIATAGFSFLILLTATIIWIGQNNAIQMVQVMVESDLNDTSIAAKVPNTTPEINQKKQEFASSFSPTVKTARRVKIKSIQARPLQKVAAAKSDFVTQIKNDDIEARERNKKDLVAALLVVSDELKKIKAAF